MKRNDDVVCTIEALQKTPWRPAARLRGRLGKGATGDLPPVSLSNCEFSFRKVEYVHDHITDFLGSKCPFGSLAGMVVLTLPELMLSPRSSRTEVEGLKKYEGALTGAVVKGIRPPDPGVGTHWWRRPQYRWLHCPTPHKLGMFSVANKTKLHSST